MNQLLAFIDRLTGIAQGDSIPAIALHAAGAVVLSAIAWIIIKTMLRTIRKRLTKFDWFNTNQRVFDMIRKTFGLGLILFLGIYLIRLLHLQMIARPPHPQPIFSILSPGLRPHLFATNSNLANCASRNSGLEGAA